MATQRGIHHKAKSLRLFCLRHCRSLRRKDRSLHAFNRTTLIQKAEAQLSAGLGISNSDARAQVLKSIKP